jgi:beta-lactam-binding protein with PASTA domain
MRRSAVTVAAGVLALAMTPSVFAAAGSKTVQVPRVVGLTESRAQCALATVGLRWRYRGDNRVHSRPLISCSSHGAVNPDPTVISQVPRGGSRIPGHGIVVLDDQCLQRVRQHGLPCA